MSHSLGKIVFLFSCFYFFTVVSSFAAKVEFECNYDQQTQIYRDCDFSNLKFSKANFQGTVLEQSNFKGADLQRSDFQKAKLNSANLDHANFQEADLQQANFQKAKFRDANLSYADLQNADLEESNLQGVSFEGANLQQTNFRRTIWGKDLISFPEKEKPGEFFEIREITLTFLQQEGVPLNVLGQLETLKKKKIFGEKPFWNQVMKIGGEKIISHRDSILYLSSNQLREAEKQRLELQHKLNLQQAEAQRFFALNVARYLFIGLVLIIIITTVIRPMVSKLSARPEDLDLLFGFTSNSLLKKGTFEGANLSHSQFVNLNLSGLSFKKAILNKANFTGATLTRVDLSYSDLRGANLSKADLSKANLSGSDLTGANLSEAILKKTDLLACNLQGANLQGSVLTQCNLENANLNESNFQQAQVFSPQIKGATFWKTDLTGADIRLKEDTKTFDFSGATWVDGKPYEDSKTALTKVKEEVLDKLTESNL